LSHGGLGPCRHATDSVPVGFTAVISRGHPRYALLTAPGIRTLQIRLPGAVLSATGQGSAGNKPGRNNQDTRQPQNADAFHFLWALDRKQTNRQQLYEHVSNTLFHAERRLTDPASCHSSPNNAQTSVKFDNGSISLADVFYSDYISVVLRINKNCPLNVEHDFYDFRRFTYEFFISWFWFVFALRAKVDEQVRSRLQCDSAFCDPRPASRNRRNG
jgi:hypothetical protein